MSDENKPTESIVAVSGLSPDFLEFLHNVIQEAQAVGSTVNIITITPASNNAGGKSSFISDGCGPGDRTCPK